MCCKKYKDIYHFVCWWLIYSPRQDAPKTSSSALRKLPEGEWETTGEPEYFIANADPGVSFDDDHFLDVIQANVIMRDLDPYERKAVVCECYAYMLVENRNISAERMRKKARKLSGISSGRLYADKLRSGKAKLFDILTSKGMIYGRKKG